MADFFSSVFTIENDDDETLLENIQYDKHSNNDNFTLTEVNKLLKELNTTKSPGPDQVHPKVLYELTDIIDKPLCTIFNSSFKTGTVPEGWRIGQITALFKKGSKNSASNYRPVSLRDRSFNLKGGRGLWFFVSFRIFFLDNTKVRIIIFFVAQSAKCLSRIQH